MTNRSLLIALDADGVLLDYNRAFGAMWKDYFNLLTLEACDTSAYHATRYWGVEAPERGHGFWDHFDQHGWRAMPAMAGAVEACQALAEAGHRLICVTSMPEHRAADRLHNLQTLEFPIERVIATGSKFGSTANPKKEAIEELNPDWFVDDELRKLKDLDGINLVLINPGHSDCPNRGQPKDFLHMEVPNLLEFAQRITRLGPKPSRAFR
jgi:phosphoglycolate phosphatase-like HAD superfamily hydrolase